MCIFCYELRGDVQISFLENTFGFAHCLSSFMILSVHINTLLNSRFIPVVVAVKCSLNIDVDCVPPEIYSTQSAASKGYGIPVV